jgi:methyl-accepting chemotaxis protein
MPVDQTQLLYRSPIMKLLTKFNLILLVLFGVGGLIISQVTYTFLFDNARREVLQEAELMMASAKSVRDYTSSDLRPLLEQNPLHKTRFLAETVPAFAALSTFSRLKQMYPDYTYREATLNPTNLEHRATDWEADVIGYLRDHADQDHVSGERPTPMGPYLYLATPLAADPPCMECHSRPDAAPAAMIATYGSSHGFGWKPGSIVAAQIVSIPMSVPLHNAKRAFNLILLYLVITLIATIFVLDAAVYFIVIRPLKLVSDTGDRVSMGEVNLPPLPVKGGDEIATVTASFNRMHVSLAKALKMLG